MRKSFAATSIRTDRRHAARRKGAERWVGPYIVAIAGPFCTSNGSATCAAPGRPLVIASKALRSTFGISAERSITAFHLVSGFMGVRWSSSVGVNLPREGRDVGVDRENRNGRLVRLDQPGQDVRRAAARGTLAHADLAGEARIAVGHVRRVPLIAR